MAFEVRRDWHGLVGGLCRSRSPRSASTNLPLARWRALAGTRRRARTLRPARPSVLSHFRLKGNLGNLGKAAGALSGPGPVSEPVERRLAEAARPETLATRNVLDSCGGKSARAGSEMRMADEPSDRLGMLISRACPQCSLAACSFGCFMARDGVDRATSVYAGRSSDIRSRSTHSVASCLRRGAGLPIFICSRSSASPEAKPQCTR